MTLTSPGGISGKWGVEKYPTADGNGRWLITTPAGHGFWCASQFAITKPTGLNVTAKYGTELNWETAALARYTGWGFNCVADYVDIGVLTDMNAGSLGARLPYWGGEPYTYYAVSRNNAVPGHQTLPTDAVKDLSATTSYLYSPYGMVADGFDPNFATYSAGFAAADVWRGNNGDPYGASDLNAWALGHAIGDSDYAYGFGPGPDDCTSVGGTYHQHIGLLALASPPKSYIQWENTGNVYDGRNWIFTDTQVYSKTNLISYLQTKYTTIAALNAAWGSGYTAFNTAATRYTGETVGSTNGVLTSLTHTLAHSGVSPESLLIKVDGVAMGTDPPRVAAGGTVGTIVSRWPDGVTTIGGTINYSTGVLTISSSAGTYYNHYSNGTTSWGTVNLGHTNITPKTLLLYLYPEQCRITDDVAEPGMPWETYPNTCPNSPYTVTGTVNYSAGTITGLTIADKNGAAIPNDGTHYVNFQFYWTGPMPGTHTVTVDYDVNGFGVGTTLSDENGSNTSWLGSTAALLPKPGNAAGLTPVPLAVWTDLSGWLQTYGEAYYASTIDAIRSYFPGKLIVAQLSGQAGHFGCPRQALVQAMADHSDLLMFSQITQPLLNMLVTWGLGDKPVMDAWEADLAEADSPFAANAPNWVGSNMDYSTQALRGAAMANQISTALTGRGVGGRSYQMVGMKWWAYSDTTGEGSNYGLVSPLDNAYDGAEAATGLHACSAPLQAYTCGGEAGNYGDAVTAVRNALLAWTTRVQ
jgi:hypothetical protein